MAYKNPTNDTQHYPVTDRPRLVDAEGALSCRGQEDDGVWVVGAVGSTTCM